MYHGVWRKLVANPYAATSPAPNTTSRNADAADSTIREDFAMTPPQWGQNRGRPRLSESSGAPYPRELRLRVATLVSAAGSSPSLIAALDRLTGGGSAANPRGDAPKLIACCERLPLLSGFEGAVGGPMPSFKLTHSPDPRVTGRPSGKPPRGSCAHTRSVLGFGVQLS